MGLRIRKAIKSVIWHGSIDIISPVSIAIRKIFIGSSFRSEAMHDILPADYSNCIHKVSDKFMTFPFLIACKMFGSDILMEKQQNE